jgi:hypothetical protein
MPKIRDLAINRIAASGADECGKSRAEWVPEPKPPEGPQCKPSPPPPPPKSVAGVPYDAVMRMKQQLQQRVKRHVHS